MEGLSTVMEPTAEQLIDTAIHEIGQRFRTFGGGRDSDTNPMAHALRDQPLQFAAGVDVRAVVEHVYAVIRRRESRPDHPPDALRDPIGHE